VPVRSIVGPPGIFRIEGTGPGGRPVTKSPRSPARVRPTASALAADAVGCFAVRRANSRARIARGVTCDGHDVAL